MGFNGLIQLIGLDFNNQVNNEAVLDKLFLHGKYAKQAAENFTSYDFNNHKAALAELNNDKKINFFAKLLRKNLISKEYYDTQIMRYQITSLKTWCKHSIFKQLAANHSEKVNEIEKLPLPNPLKRFLEKDFAIADRQPSPSP
ncbi:MAG: hypothetical protein E6K54_06555 [Gammaproteobacteria bacterium]|nr:MAG: hypothetical protein E6K54_06555 [Gammaproteobacteria bacterium]